MTFQLLKVLDVLSEKSLHGKICVNRQIFQKLSVNGIVFKLNVTKGVSQCLKAR